MNKKKFAKLKERERAVKKKVLARREKIRERARKIAQTEREAWENSSGTTIKNENVEKILN